MNCTATTVTDSSVGLSVITINLIISLIGAVMSFLTHIRSSKCCGGSCAMNSDAPNTFVNGHETQNAPTIHPTINVDKNGTVHIGTV